MSNTSLLRVLLDLRSCPVLGKHCRSQEGSWEMHCQRRRRRNSCCSRYGLIHVHVRWKMQALAHWLSKQPVRRCVYACVCICGAYVECSCKCIAWFHETCQAETSRYALYRTWPSVRVCACLGVCSSTSIINSATVLHMCHRLFLLPCVVNCNIFPSPSAFTSILNCSLPCHKMLSVRFPLLFHSAELKPIELVWFV